MSILTLPHIVIVNSAGVPYGLAKLYTYAPGTTTPRTTYQDEDLLVQHTNPIVADADGVFPIIYTKPLLGFTMRIIATTSADVEIFDYDDIPLAQSDFAGATFTLAVSMEDQLTVEGIAEFQNGVYVQGNEPRLIFQEDDASTNAKFWDIDVNGAIWSLRTRSGVDGAGKNILVVTRNSTTTAITGIDIGNATDLPTITFNGVTLFANGSFTATLSDMAASTTGTVYYVRVGKMITLYVSLSNIVGTSNDNSMVLTGIPSTMYPVNNSFTTLCHNVRDDSNTISCVATIGAGIITFSPLKTDAVTDYVSADSDGFTPSGSKGLLIGWSVSYPTNE